MLQIKDGVDLSMIDPRMWPAASKILEVYSRYGHECTITSGREGRHGAHSLHYKGRALDFRTRHLSESQKIKVSTEIRGALGPDYDVILEATHLHIEFDPK